jgi:hypothetical protein
MWHHYLIVIDRSVIATWLGIWVFVDGVEVAVVPDLTSAVSGNFANDTLYILQRSGGLYGAGKICNLVFRGGYLGGVKEAVAEFADPWALFEPRTIKIPHSQPSVEGPVLITIRPTSDITTGAWTPSAGGTLYGVLDEVTYDDVDYISTTSASTAEVKFEAANAPSVDTNHTIYYRAKGTSGALEVRLYQGTTLIATHNPSLTGSYQTFTWNLTEGEAGSITDYSDLRVRFIGS